MAARFTAPIDDAGHSLALAMVASSTAPLLLLDGDRRIMAASVSFCRTFEIAAKDVAGRRLFDLGAGEWNRPQLRSLINATASGDAVIDAYEMDFEQAGRSTRRLVLNVQKLAYGHPESLRLLVSITDMTASRLSQQKADELARANEMLVEEVRHRIANSLQIVASVLMQNARRTTSDETRAQLRDAHSRVLSVADLQKQLAASTLGTVRIGAYLTKLCETIGASMISDPEALSIEVVAQDELVDAGTSVSLGLVVTELVINALKHAFPAGGGGRILVDYRGDAGTWSLSVQDTGVGMPAGRAGVTPGLGTSIVEALARQLRARVDVEATAPGCKVSIVHVAEDASRHLAPPPVETTASPA